ncbi:hypothetical protein FRC08_018539 [Ceratobasidium sp. 394]|nr:hypothetical protein FRC08_018539 [Ceratobasidium sp. 394]
MGAYTVIASYYNGRFYDIWVLYDASNPLAVIQMLQQIPNNPSERKVWIETQRKQLGDLEPNVQRSKAEVMIKENNCLIPGAGHSRSAPNYLVRSCLKSNTPLECIGAVSRWSKLSLDTNRIDEDYEYLRAIETQASDWGVPGWDELSVSQTLCTKLVQAILTDHADIFTNPDVADQRSMHNLCCWQLVSAAAPSLLVCPPMAQAQLDLPNTLVAPRFQLGSWHAGPHFFEGNIRMLEGLEKYQLEFYQEMQERKMNAWDHVYWTLRGCLIMFCPRLDTPDHVKVEILSTVAALRRSPSGKSVAVVFSGKHVIAVSVDDGVIRHSPPLLVHDLKMNLQDGALLLVHLLNPQPGNKTYHHLSQRWEPEFKGPSGVFPGEILTEIIHYADYEAWSLFFQVSYYTRSVCLSHPRVNDSILLRAVDGGFMVRDRTTGYQHAAHMTRVDWKVHKHLDSTFHVRQAGLATQAQAEAPFTVLSPNQYLYKHFTPSHKEANMTCVTNLRLLGIWGRWIVEDGVAGNEHWAATPRRPAYWRPILFEHINVLGL